MSITLETPRSDTRRLRTLKQTIASANRDSLDGDMYVRPDVITAATTTYASFDAAMAAVSEQLAARIKVVNQKDEAFQRLEWHVRDAWECLKRRVRRNGEDSAVFANYGLAQDGIVAGATAQRGWLDFAQVIINGDDEAARAGSERLRSPNQAEIQAAYAAAELLFETAVPAADKVYNKAQEAVANLRPQVDDVLADVVRDMRYNLSIAKMEKESERRVMRGYGFEFVTRTSTAEDAVDEMLAGEEVINN